MKNSIRILKSMGLLSLVLGLGACADQEFRTKPGATYESAAASPFIGTNYRAADTLIAQLGKSLSAEQPLIVATVVNINDLEKSSPLGRTLSEQISAQFTRHGFRMIEMKFRNSVYIKRSQGELLLTREIQELALSHNAQAVIVGSYSEAQDLVFINLKVIRPGDNIVLAAHDYVMPKDSTVRSLLTH